MSSKDSGASDSGSGQSDKSSGSADKSSKSSGDKSSGSKSGKSDGSAESGRSSGSKSGKSDGSAESGSSDKKSSGSGSGSDKKSSSGSGSDKKSGSSGSSGSETSGSGSEGSSSSSSSSSSKKSSSSSRSHSDVSDSGEMDGSHDEMEMEDLSPLKEWFMSLPEPAGEDPETLANQSLIPLIKDPYLKGLQENISALSQHVQSIQNEEIELTKKFLELNSSANEKDGEKLRKDFVDKIYRIRRNRAEYRGLMFDAMQERNNILRSQELASFQQDLLKKKLQESNPPRGIDTFYFLFFLVQLAIIICYLLFANFEDLPAAQPGVNGAPYPFRADNYYTFYANIALLVFVGFGLLMSSSKKYLFSSLALHFLMCAFAVELTILFNGFLQWADSRAFGNITLNLKQIINGMYGAAACSVSYGAFVGLISLEGLLMVTAIEVAVYVINHWVCVRTLEMVDPGGGVTIHLFGGLFGIAASAGIAWAFNRTERYKENKPSYSTEIFSLVGALFVFIFLPGFNAALAPAGTQGRAVTNTVYGMTTSAILTMAIAHWYSYRKSYRMTMTDLQNGLFIGGISIASASNLIVAPVGPVLLAFVAVPLSFLCYYYLRPILAAFSHYHDVTGVLFRHVIPGIVAALGAVISLNVYVGDRKGGVNYEDMFRSKYNQDVRNLYGSIVTIVISLFGGLVTGAIAGGMRDSNILKKPSHPFLDENFSGLGAESVL